MKKSKKQGKLQITIKQKYGTMVLLGITYPKFFSKLITLVITHSNSRPEVFCKKDVPEIFAKFTGKYLCHSF